MGATSTPGATPVPPTATGAAAAPAAPASQAVDAYTAAQAEQDRAAKHSTRIFKVWRGDADGGGLQDYTVEVSGRRFDVRVIGPPPAPEDTDPSEQPEGAAAP